MLEDKKKGLIRNRKLTRDMNLEKGQKTRAIHCKHCVQGLNTFLSKY